MHRVKPEDVPVELRQDIAKRLFDHHVREWEVAAIINAAIEAGLVSPPVLCMRFQGVLQRENCVPMVCVDAPKMSPQSLISYEHWKGQTE